MQVVGGGVQRAVAAPGYALSRRAHTVSTSAAHLSQCQHVAAVRQPVDRKSDLALQLATVAATASLLGAPSACAIEALAAPATDASMAGHAPQLVADLAESSSQVYMDMAVDGKPVGRVVIELFDDVRVGGQRFMELAKGLDGASYRRSKFDEITPDYVKNAGVKQLTYRAEAETRLAGGRDTFELEKEMESSRHSHDAPGVVSLVVKQSKEREVKTKLVAYKGKLVNVEEAQGGEVPNGTQFVLTLRASPELDYTNLPVGRVVVGQDVVEALGALPVVKDNSSSPYFKAGKFLGDKRADVAERGFNRPFSKVTVMESGMVAGAVEEAPPPSAAEE